MVAFSAQNIASYGLVGIYEGVYERHLEPDWLLIYEIRKDVLILMLYWIGTHSEPLKR